MLTMNYVSESANENYDYSGMSVRNAMMRACDAMKLHIYSSNEFVKITLVQDETVLLTLTTD